MTHARPNHPLGHARAITARPNVYSHTCIQDVAKLSLCTRSQTERVNKISSVFQIFIIKPSTKRGRYIIRRISFDRDFYESNRSKDANGKTLAFATKAGSMFWKLWIDTFGTACKYIRVNKKTRIYRIYQGTATSPFNRRQRGPPKYRIAVN